jgi:hypothetical protein
MNPINMFTDALSFRRLDTICPSVIGRLVTRVFSMGTFYFVCGAGLTLSFMRQSGATKGDSFTQQTEAQPRLNGNGET